MLAKDVVHTHRVAHSILRDFLRDSSVSGISSDNLIRFMETTECGPHIDSVIEQILIDKLFIWLCSRVKEKTITIRTAQRYKKDLYEFYQDQKHYDKCNEINAWLFRQSTIDRSTSDSKALIARQSSNKKNGKPSGDLELEHLPAADWVNLANMLQSANAKGKPNYKHGNYTSCLFQAILMTGLRPSEWLSARLESNYTDPVTLITRKHVLFVNTLKQQHRRDDNPLREYRLLDLSEWSNSQLAIIRYVLEIYRSNSESAMQRMYDSARVLLKRTYQKYMGNQDNSVSLNFYTARHIFAEEVRRSKEYSSSELAVLLGHTLLTNQRYYGVKSHSLKRSYSFDLPKAWSGDAEAVAMWDKTINPRDYLEAKKERAATDGLSFDEISKINSQLKSM